MKWFFIILIIGIGFAIWGAIDSTWINPDGYSSGDDLEQPASWSSGVYSN